MTQPSSEEKRTPRAEKVAVVAEIRDRLAAASGTMLTEYRGLNTEAMAELRRALAAVGGSYKIYKNTLVRLAVRELGIDCEHLLVGPTALAFADTLPDGKPGDAAAVAKALFEFQRTDRRLVVKGGLLGTDSLGPEAVEHLSRLPPAEQLHAQMAGLLASPMQRFAGLLAAPIGELAGLVGAPTRTFAGLLQALIDERAGSGG